MHKMNKVPLLDHSWRKPAVQSEDLDICPNQKLWNALLFPARPSRKLGTLIIPGILPSDCLTQKRESYLLRMVRVLVKEFKDQHKDVVTGSIRRYNKGLNNL